MDLDCWGIVHIPLTAQNQTHADSPSCAFVGFSNRTECAARKGQACNVHVRLHLCVSVCVCVLSICSQNNDLKHKSPWLGLQLMQSDGMGEPAAKDRTSLACLPASLAVCPRSIPHTSVTLSLRSFPLTGEVQLNSNCGWFTTPKRHFSVSLSVLSSPLLLSFTHLSNHTLL